MSSFPRYFIVTAGIALLLSCSGTSEDPGIGTYVLYPGDFRHYVEYFNRMEVENIVRAVPNSDAWAWMESNIPFFECPQDNFEEIYYFRWWTLRKHIRQTPQGRILTEFLVDRSYADRYNMISSALGHHIFEARWLHDRGLLDEYLHVWYRGNEGGEMDKLRNFSSWTAWALYNRYLVDGNLDFLLDMREDLEKEFGEWEQERRLPGGLFWQYDVRDGMEEQISGGRREKNARPTINSYMYGNAFALSQITKLAGDETSEALYTAKADSLRKLVIENLWDPESAFFETRKETGQFAGVREEIGYIPWYVNLADREQEEAWLQIADPEGFLAPYGLTTAEQRHPEFRTHGCCNCEWDGAVWPFATSQTLTGFANYLNRCVPERPVVNENNSGKETGTDSGNESRVASDGGPVPGDSMFFRHMELYVESQYLRGRPYIGEYLDETTGYWLKGDQERSRYYNHSTFNDLIITGIVGLRPREDGAIEVNPLLPEDKWDWFCLDGVLYHGRVLSIVWDREGNRYGMGSGFHILADGREVGSSPILGRLVIE